MKIMFLCFMFSGLFMAMGQIRRMRPLLPLWGIIQCENRRKQGKTRILRQKQKAA